MKRRQILRAAAAAPAVAAESAALGNRTSAHRADKAPAVAGAARRDLTGMNVILFMTDQQRAIQHFPKGWAKKNLPGWRRLKKHGLVFSEAVCNTTMCSPSRSTLMTGYFPAQHGVKNCLEADMPASDGYPQAEMPLDLLNIGDVMAAAGYRTPYKGKWHCSKAAAGVTDPATDPPCVPNEGWVPDDVNKFGFERWDPQDAGANQDVCQAGGGDIQNDGRFMNDDGSADAGEEGALTYLQNVAKDQQPFFLTISLVNPHDVLAYPSNFEAFGYDNSWLDSTGIKLPKTVDEDLSTKPSAQQQLLAISAPLRPKTPEQQINYLNFYGNLMKSSDNYLVQVLDTLEDQDLLDNTLIIFTSDHGEMGMTHGGQIQKNFNFYEETVRVPLVFSNPKLYPKGKTSKALVSHVDFLPTMASLFDVPASARADWQGVDYSSVVLDPNAKGPQDYTVFTYDDYQSGQANPPYPRGATHIVSIREKRYKLAKYYWVESDDLRGEANPQVPDEWEMYDLKRDGSESQNIAWPEFKRSKNQQKQLDRLKAKLAQIERDRLQPLNAADRAKRKNR
jgi:choline-sulfatase